MNGSPAGRYAQCPVCGALSMPMRRSCCQCGSPLAAQVQRAPLGGSLVGDSVVGTRAIVTERRRDPRRDCAAVTAMMEAEGYPPQQVTLRNASAGGVAVASEVGYKVGTGVVLHIPIDGRRCRVDGVVRHVTAQGLGGFAGYQVGIEFMSTVPPLSRLV